MSDRDWRHYPYVGVALFALIPLGLTALSDEYEVIRKTENTAAAEHLSDAKKRRLTSEPPARNPNPTREEWRQEKDLEAQQQMAVWARLMFVITAAGVWYVAKTLGATQAAVEAAEKTNTTTLEMLTAEKMARSGIVRVNRVQLKQDGNRIIFEIQSQNIGETIALDVWHHPIWRTFRRYRVKEYAGMKNAWVQGYSKIRGGNIVRDPNLQLSETSRFGKDLVAGGRYVVNHSAGELDQREREAFDKGELFFEVITLTHWWNVYKEVQYRNAFWQAMPGAGAFVMFESPTFIWNSKLLEPNKPNTYYTDEISMEEAEVLEADDSDYSNQ